MMMLTNSIQWLIFQNSNTIVKLYIFKQNEFKLLNSWKTGMKSNHKNLKSKNGYESDGDSMEYFEADLTYHDNEIAIEYPELTTGQYGIKACKDVKNG